MRSYLAKILMLACLALVLGVKALTLLSAGEFSIVHSPHQKVANELSLAAHHTINDGHDKHVSQTPEKQSYQQATLFEGDNTNDAVLKKEFRAELTKLFASFAKFELSSRILAFHKSYSVLLSVSEHHSPLYMLDHALLI